MKRSIKNILYINSSAVMYGAETRLLDIIRNLDKSKFRPFALLPNAGPLENKLKELGVVTIRLDYTFKITKSPIYKFFILTNNFIRLTRQHKIDLIHVNMHFKMSNLWLAFLILRKPVIVHLRSHFYVHIFEKFVMCRTFKAICISKYVEKEFLKWRRSSFFMCQHPNHTEIIYDGIDVNQFASNPSEKKIRKELNIDSQDFLVGLIGAMDKVKGQDVLVKAADIVIRKHPKTKFVLVGDIYADYPRKIKYRSDLINLIKDLNLTDSVILTGFRNDIDAFMNEIDILVQPSEHEGLGTSMVEAMACAKPVIGTNIDGIPEVIGDNEGGLLLNPRTPEELAKDIIFFIENRQEAEKIGMNGRKRALKLFNAKENIQRIQKIYDEAINHS